MSLINQMLKDLEARRANTTPVGYLPGPSEPLPQRHHGQRLVVPLLATLALFALLSGWLLWERLTVGDTETANSPASDTTIVAAPVLATPPAPTEEMAADEGEATTAPSPHVTSSTAEPEQTASAPVAAATAPTAPTAVDPVISATAVEPAAPQPETASQTNAATTEPMTDEAPALIERRVRPPSPEQLAEQHYQQGYRLLQQGRQQEGEARWQEALAEHPAHVPSREGLAGIYLNQNRHTEAASLLQQGLDHHPGHGRFAMLLARVQLAQQQQPQAIITLERGLDQRPQGGDYLSFLAALYQREQRFADSVTGYQQALALQPDQAAWWLGLGISHEGAGNPSEAREAYLQALQRGGLSPALQEYAQQRLRAVR